MPNQDDLLKIPLDKTYCYINWPKADYILQDVTLWYNAFTY